MANIGCKANKDVIALKEQKVAELVEKIKKAKSVILIDYSGITVAEDTALRAEMRKSGVEYKVVKNTALSRAFKEAGFDGLDQYLEKTTAVAFSYEDAVAGAKVISDTTAKIKKLAFKGGIIEGVVSNEQQIVALSKIPPKPVLLAQLLGLLTSPMRSLAVAISEVAKKKAA